MFWTGRAYGFPGPFLVLSKTTDLMEEAKKVHHLSTLELFRQGWQPRFTSTLDSPISYSPIINLVVNFGLSFVVGFIFLKVISRIKRNK